MLMISRDVNDLFMLQTCLFGVVPQSFLQSKKRRFFVQALVNTKIRAETCGLVVEIRDCVCRSKMVSQLYRYIAALLVIELRGKKIITHFCLS